LALPLTEAEARAVLAAFDAIGEVEQWIAEQWWEAIPGGWRVQGQFHGRCFLLESVPGGVRVFMREGEGAPANWFVPARRGG